MKSMIFKMILCHVNDNTTIYEDVDKDVDIDIRFSPVNLFNFI